MDFSKLLEEVRRMASEVPLWRVWSICLALSTPVLIWKGADVAIALMR
jgi:hypothetical protein